MVRVTGRLDAAVREAQRVMPVVPVTLPRHTTRGLPSLVSTEIGYGTVNGVVAGPPRPVVVDAARPSAGPARISGGITRVWGG